jgi:hypothetical protein
MLARIVLAAAVLVAALPAQVTSSVRAGTDYGVVASQTFAVIPNGTPTTRPTTVHASAPAAQAEATIKPLPTGFRLVDAGSATRNLWAAGIAATAPDTTNRGPHDLLWTLGGQGAGAIVLDLWAFGGLGTNEVLTCAVDVGDDGTIEFLRRGPWFDRVELPVTVTGPLPIRVRTEGFAVPPYSGANSGYRLELTARFARVVVPVTFTPYGPSCGATLSGSESRTTIDHRLRFDVNNALPNAPVLLVIGGRRIAIPIGTSGCTLLTEPFAWQLVIAGATGAATLPLTVEAFNGSARVQAFPFDPANPTAFRGAHGLELVFAD